MRFCHSYDTLLHHSVREIADGMSNSSQLVPNVDIPVSIEIVFDVTVGDFTISPMIAVEVCVRNKKNLCLVLLVGHLTDTLLL